MARFTVVMREASDLEDKALFGYCDVKVIKVFPCKYREEAELWAERKNRESDIFDYWCYDVPGSALFNRGKSKKTNKLVERN